MSLCRYLGRYSSFHVFSVSNVITLSGPTTMMSEGTKNIVNAMKARGISKVIGCMSGIEENKLDAFNYCIIFCDFAFM